MCDCKISPITFSLTENDLVKFNEFYNSTSKAVKGLKDREFLFFLAIGVASIFSLLCGIMQNNEDKLAIALSSSFLWIPIYCLYRFKIYPGFEKSRSRLIIREEKNKDLICRHEISINSKGIKDSGEYGITEFKWEVIEKVFIAPCHIYFLLGAHRAIIIPKNAFENENHMKKFLETAQSFSSEVADKKGTSQ